MDRDSIIKALRIIFTDFGAESFFTDSSYISNGLKEMLIDSDELIDALRYAVDCGVGKMYLPFVMQKMIPGNGFRENAVQLLVDHEFSYEYADYIVGIFNELLGWDYVQVTAEYDNNNLEPAMEIAQETAAETVMETDVETPETEQIPISADIEQPAPTPKKKIVILIAIVSLLAFISLSVFPVINSMNSDTEESAAETNSPTATTAAQQTTASFSKNEIVTFGSYSGQDIEWIVIDTKGSDVLLLSKYAIDGKAYNNKSDASWSNSSLREWLNNGFLSTAFNAAAQRSIITSSINTDGTVTNDRVFLLSESEVKKYLNNSQCKASVTDYASQVLHPDNRYVKWWLRGKGEGDGCACYVSPFGDVSKYGDTCTTKLGIRPAMWVKTA